MARVERASPQSVFDLFKSLDNDAQRAFIRILAHHLSVEAFFDMLAQLDPLEQKKFSDMVGETLMPLLLPQFAREAIDLVKELPETGRDELVPILSSRVAQIQKLYDSELGKLAEATLKQKRDRKSDPETVRRNVEICNLRKHDRKKWTLGKLASRFQVTRRAISLVLVDEAKWRRLAGEEQVPPQDGTGADL